jgi:hypothetical protein
MVNPIVTVGVLIQQAPQPATLQEMGALISQGATTLASGTSHLLTQLSDLTALLVDTLAVTSITQSAGLATATTTAPHGYPMSEVVPLTIAGSTIAAYNGVKQATITGASTFTFAIASGTTSPATGTIMWTPEDVAELTAMATSFFAQGRAQAIWVLELGEGDAADGVTALNTYITANPNSNYTPGQTGYFYAYLVPRNWADEATYITFLAQFESNTSKTYFYTTMTTGNYTSFTQAMKCVFGLVEAPGVAAANTEFSLAAPLYWWLGNRPSGTNKVPPFAFTELFGITPWPTVSNGATLVAFKAANINYVGTGGEGGIATSILFFGRMLGGKGASYWYSIDWIQINEDLDISNEVINGSNSKINPLYYNQPGINRLQARGGQTAKRAITCGMALGTINLTKLTPDAFAAAIAAGTFNGQIVINAIPFLDYVEENPDDYDQGEYDGLACLYITQNGFIHILFNIQVTGFVAAP